MRVADILCAMPEMTLMHEDFAVHPAITIPDFNPRYSKIVGTMDGLDVWLTRFFGEKYNTFAYKDGEQAIAFVVVESLPTDSAYKLVRIWSDSKHRGRGLVTALILFLTKKLNMRLLLQNDEPLTDDGWDWLIRAVHHNKIKAFDASTSQQLNAKQLKQDRKLQKKTGGKTDLSIIIERDISRFPLFGSGGYRQLNEMIYVIDGPLKLD